MIKNSQGEKTMSIKEANKRSGARLRRKAFPLTKSRLDSIELALVSAGFVSPKSITSRITLGFSTASGVSCCFGFHREISLLLGTCTKCLTSENLYSSCNFESSNAVYFRL